MVKMQSMKTRAVRFQVLVVLPSDQKGGCMVPMYTHSGIAVFPSFERVYGVQDHGTVPFPSPAQWVP